MIATSQGIKQEGKNALIHSQPRLSVDVFTKAVSLTINTALIRLVTRKTITLLTRAGTT